MRIYQTIHKYAPHIPLFEKRYNITDKTDISFSELRRLILDDGYASSYILLPAIEGKTDQVFFTIWDYDRLQHLWAKEHGLNSKNLSVIKHAQIEWYKPDVFYNHSAFCDNNFIKKFQLDKNILRICWFGLVLEKPYKFEDYNIRLSLHRPFIKKWSEMGLKSYEFQGSVDKRFEKFISQSKPIDFLFYGQYASLIFEERNKLVDELLKYTLKSKLNIKIHLQCGNLKKPFINVRFIRRLGYNTAHSKFITTNSFPPLYGQELYEAIGKSKFVINAFGNYNKDFKSNMRDFESLSCGSLLISEDGNYPDGFEANKNFIPYKNSEELIGRLSSLHENYSSLQGNMMPYIIEVKNLYSKENQWAQFQRIVNDNK